MSTSETPSSPVRPLLIPSRSVGVFTVSGAAFAQQRKHFFSRVKYDNPHRFRATGRGGEGCGQPAPGSDTLCSAGDVFGQSQWLIRTRSVRSSAADPAVSANPMRRLTGQVENNTQSYCWERKATVGLIFSSESSGILGLCKEVKEKALRLSRQRQDCYSSPPLNLGSNGFTCPPGREIRFAVSARSSNPSLTFLFPLFYCITTNKTQYCFAIVS